MSSAADATTTRHERLSFFRQSGWMIVATAVSGFLMSLVHNSAGRIGPAQFGLFTTMLDLLPLLGIPVGGLQGVFAQMTAFAVTEAQQRELRLAVRAVLRGSLLLAALLAIALALGQRSLIELWKADGPAVLWITLATAFLALWSPVFAGVLQGRQNFLWLGHSSIAAGLGRLVAVTVLVLGFGVAATGAMVGVLLGAVVALGTSAWAARDLLSGEAGGQFAWGSWIRRLLPVTFGLAAGSVLLSFDTPFVRGMLRENDLDAMGLYAAAGRIGRALVMFTMPMAQVLFPRVARSAATGESTGVLRLALGATLGTALMAALACTLLPELPLRVLYAGQPGFLRAAPLIPWFAWCMLPLTAAYTLVNDLIARGRFRAVPWLVAVAGGYMLTLTLARDHLRGLPALDAFRTVLMTLGCFSLLLLGVAVLFSVCGKRSRA